MPEPIQVNVGDIVELRKAHPSGSKRWVVVRVGSDVVLKNVEGERRITLTRSKFNKSVKRVITPEGEPPADEPQSD